MIDCIRPRQGKSAVSADSSGIDLKCQHTRPSITGGRSPSMLACSLSSADAIAQLLPWSPFAVEPAGIYLVVNAECGSTIVELVAADWREQYGAGSCAIRAYTCLHFGNILT
jgi:hypothetical protein